MQIILNYFCNSVAFFKIIDSNQVFVYILQYMPIFAENTIYDRYKKQTFYNED